MLRTRRDDDGDASGALPRGLRFPYGDRCRKLGGFEADLASQCTDLQRMHLATGWGTFDVAKAGQIIR